MSPAPKKQRRRGALWLCLALALALAGAASAGRLSPAEITGRSPKLGLWRAFLPYGSEAGAEPEARAFSEVGDLLDLADQLRRSLADQPETVARLYQLRRDLIALDLDRIFAGHPLFFAGTDGERLMRVTGQWKNDRYEFAVGNVPPLGGAEPRLGNLAAEVGFLRNSAEPDLVRFRTRATADLGTLLYREMLESWEVFNRLLWMDQIHREKWLGRVDLPTVGLGRRLDLNDLELFSQWIASFPNLSALLARVSTVEDLVNPAPHPKTGGPSQVRLLIKLRRDRMKELYPEDFATLRFLVDRVSFQTDFLTEAGTFLARVAYRAQGHEFDASYLTQEGGFAVADRQGYPVGQLIVPGKAERLSYTARTNLRIDLYGLTVYLDELPISCRYEGPSDWEAPERLSRFTVQMNQPPKVRVEGALLYVIPTWLLDAIIPGTVADLLSAFFDLLVHGNGMQGMVVGFDFQEAGGRHRVDADLSVELPYQLLGPFVQDVVRSEWADLPSKEMRPKELLNDLRKAFREDFEKARSKEEG